MINMIKKFPNIFKYEKDAELHDLNIYLSNVDQYPSVEWIYLSTEDKFALIGLNGDDVCAIDSEGILRFVCSGVENIPYEFLRINSEYTDSETLSELFVLEPVLKKELAAYEDWCGHNNIILDRNKIYHDAHGVLFDSSN